MDIFSKLQLESWDEADRKVFQKSFITTVNLKLFSKIISTGYMSEEEVIKLTHETPRNEDGFLRAFEKMSEKNPQLFLNLMAESLQETSQDFTFEILRKTSEMKDVDDERLKELVGKLKALLAQYPDKESFLLNISN